MIHRTLFILFIVAICVTMTLTGLAGCATSAPPKGKAAVEQKISDANFGRFDDVRVIVLPSGERVLVLSGANGLSACCLLPPLPVEKSK